MLVWDSISLVFHLNETSWTMDYTGKPRKLCTEGLTATFYCSLQNPKLRCRSNDSVAHRSERNSFPSPFMKCGRKVNIFGGWNWSPDFTAHGNTETCIRVFENEWICSSSHTEAIFFACNIVMWVHVWCVWNFFDVGTTHIDSSASQSQFRSHPMLGSG
jgi:hypothetical protein